ncbi:Anoctamin-1, partial [Araneus ventricosus]
MLLFVIWICPKAKRRYWPQVFNSRIFRGNVQIDFILRVLLSSDLSLKEEVLCSAATLVAYKRTQIAHEPNEWLAVIDAQN